MGRGIPQRRTRRGHRLVEEYPLSPALDFRASVAGYRVGSADKASARHVRLDGKASSK
jgi:hypothetical protein